MLQVSWMEAKTTDRRLPSLICPLLNTALFRGVASGEHGGKSVQSSIPNEKRSLERATAEAVRSEGDTTGTALTSAILPASVKLAV